MVSACSFMARAPLDTACRRRRRRLQGLPRVTCAGARSASGDRGGAETIPFVGIQKCHALICFYAHPTPFRRTTPKAGSACSTAVARPNGNDRRAHLRGPNPRRSAPPAGASEMRAWIGARAFRAANADSRRRTAVAAERPTPGRGSCTPRRDRSGPTPRGSSGTRCRRRPAHRACLAGDPRRPTPRPDCPAAARRPARR